MKKILFYLSTAVFAFALSLCGVYVFNFFTAEIKGVDVSDETLVYSNHSFSENRIDIEYKYTVRGKEFNNGVFLVTNLTDDFVYYHGYEKNKPIDRWVRQDGKTMMTGLLCFIEVKEYEIKPFGSVTFEIPIPRDKKSFEAGFDFYTEANNKAETTWIKIDKQKVFVEKVAHSNKIR